MESMGRKKPRPRRSFTPEFKAEIVELCQREDRSVGQVEACARPKCKPNSAVSRSASTTAHSWSPNSSG
jgi:hypothetical protein